MSVYITVKEAKLLFNPNYDVSSIPFRFNVRSSPRIRPCTPTRFLKARTPNGKPPSSPPPTNANSTSSSTTPSQREKPAYSGREPSISIFFYLPPKNKFYVNKPIPRFYAIGEGGQQRRKPVASDILQREQELPG